MNYYTIRIYCDEQPRLFTLARFDRVMANDKDVAHSWGENMARHLGAVKSSVYVDWLSAVTTENL